MACDRRGKNKIKKARRLNKKKDRKRDRRSHEKRCAPVDAAAQCPYCNQPTELVSGLTLYGRADLADRTYYRCQPCKAWVNCHVGTIRPMGIPAKQNLRSLRNDLHAKFDSLWLNSKNPARSRVKLYDKLAHLMGIPFKSCHIAMFTEDECKLALSILDDFKDQRVIKI